MHLNLLTRPLFLQRLKLESLRLTWEQSRLVVFLPPVYQIKELKEKVATLQEEAARLKTLIEKQEHLVQDLTEKHGGYDTVY